ncbi:MULTISPECIES: sugar phosphate isomerase/epimerase family protein [Staphylococcus]|uniref:Xylose isomerase-like TIM barrel domain-containing protein n=1 Tax=Staphylococcus xylosus TaxID=1288 RepID=A0A418ILI9_STAXY|nr:MULTISPECIES: TIM barrel protein [Staphylococcus]MBF0813738.1 TIM barrel protein [Staphylococcus saprophyticus]MDW8543636.1 TIM barrel protein [Staphylococcus sp. KG4-1]MRF37210.1 TIM barrel protein [Staphylococcus sp. KY49P]MDW8563068.1 TIM barrel protein [Staphylococcus sp. KG4-3]NQD97793.1 TIM barrel protein [Staphylococcus xylosus]
MTINFGCQGSTWVLDYDEKADKMDQVIHDIANAGLTGVDVQINLLGKYEKSPQLLKEALDKNNLQLAALTVPHAFVGGHASDSEKEIDDYFFNYLKHFPGAIMNVPSRSGKNRDNLLQRQKEIITGANELAKRAYEEHGITTSLHPISYETSYWKFEEDYKVLFNGLDGGYMGYTPDAGHIAMGGMNPSKVFEDAISLIKHVHYKDVANQSEWKNMGAGDIDFSKCTQILKDNDYNGWIMLEDEIGEAHANTTQVIKDLGNYVQNHLQPIIDDK